MCNRTHDLYRNAQISDNTFCIKMLYLINPLHLASVSVASELQKELCGSIFFCKPSFHLLQSIVEIILIDLEY